MQSTGVTREGDVQQQLNRILCRPGLPRKAEDKRSSPTQAALVYTCISFNYYIAATIYQPQYFQRSEGGSEAEEKNLCSSPTDA